MAKSSGDFLRLKTLMDRGYDPLTYRYFCLSASYRSKLNFTWESVDGAATGLNRLRKACYELGKAGAPDEAYINRFFEHINNDLNMPRAMALTWELTRSDLQASTKKATMCEFDKVLGLGLTEWEPSEDIVPDEIMNLAQQRQQARTEKRWTDADIIRDQVLSAGYEIDDTPEGPQIRIRKQKFNGN